MSNNEGVAEELLLRVAWFYYKDELTQDEIAKRLSVSRASVGRMLDRARKVGLVSINLNADHLDAFEVSRQLRQTFGLSEALVVPDHAAGEGERPALNARLGLGGAQFMSTHLRPGGTLGVGWGDTVSRVIAATNFGAVGPVRMVSLTGGVDAYLPAFLSSKGEGELTSATVIPTPIVASTPELAAALKAEPSIQQVLKQACGVQQAIVGVGTPTADATIVQMGHLEALDVRELRDRHVVGDILGQFFDASGQVVKLPIHDRRIGIELSDLDTIEWMHERRIAAFLPDGDGETVPSNVEGMLYPVHPLQVTAMGMLAADSLQLEDVAAACAAEGRFEFMVVGLPLRLPGATGSPWNPIAIF